MNLGAREGLGEFVEKHVAGDTNRTLKPEAKRSAEAAESFVAQEIMDMEKELAAQYDKTANETMVLTGKSTDTEIGKRFYETLMAEKEKYIAAAIKKTLDDKSKTLVDAKDELEKLMVSAGTN